MTDRVERLERDVEALSESELQRFALWFTTFQHDVWERRIARDADAGRLDFLVDEAREERRERTLKDL
ncbi:MAG: hypothetical protein AMXMBFR81_08790 [Chthonomonas sp.]|nr:hypothetical protein [Fimbriimonadaceae bacterium]